MRDNNAHLLQALLGPEDLGLQVKGPVLLVCLHQVREALREGAHRQVVVGALWDAGPAIKRRGPARPRLPTRPFLKRARPLLRRGCTWVSRGCCLGLGSCTGLSLLRPRAAR